MTNTDIWMVSLTGLIALGGIISATIFNSQLSVMQGQLDEMKSTGIQTNEMIAANKVLAAAAEKSAKVAEDGLFKLQRAFVSVQSFHGLSHTNPVTKKVWWSFHTAWTNSGASPTRNAKFYVSRYLEERDIDDSFEFKIPDDIIRPIQFLGPRGTIGSAEIHVEGDDLLAVQNGEKFLYLWGRTDYRDIFDNTSDHVTKFFIRVGIRGDPTKEWNQTSNIVEFIFNGAGRHNCADEECNQEK